MLLPDLDAGCSLADSITRRRAAAWQAEHPGAITVMYVNTTAAIKAITDYCCTSSNAVKVVEHIAASTARTTEILFGPDMFLGAYVEKTTGHARCTSGAASATCTPASARPTSPPCARRIPGADFLIHPECGCVDVGHGVRRRRRRRRRAASTCCRPAGCSTTPSAPTRAAPGPTVIVATETGMLYPMRKAAPDVDLHRGQRGRARAAT